MLVDDYEQYPNEKTDVVVVSRSGSDASEPAPSAADRMFLSTAPSHSHSHETKSAGMVQSIYVFARRTSTLAAEACTRLLHRADPNQQLTEYSHGF